MNHFLLGATGQTDRQIPGLAPAALDGHDAPLSATPRTMTTTRWLYWISTAVIAVLMGWSSLYFAFGEGQSDAFRRLGLPDWFRIELASAKLLGALALMIPSVPDRIKEFAYFGFGLTIASADIAHLSSGDSPWLVVPHAGFFAILVASYASFHRLRGTLGRSRLREQG